jgi:hypothetical protein
MEGVLRIAFWLDGTTQAYGAPGAYGQKPSFKDHCFWWGYRHALKKYLQFLECFIHL